MDGVITKAPDLAALEARLDKLALAVLDGKPGAREEYQGTQADLARLRGEAELQERAARSGAARAAAERAAAEQALRQALEAEHTRKDEAYRLAARQLGKAVLALRDNLPRGKDGVPDPTKLGKVEATVAPVRAAIEGIRHAAREASAAARAAGGRDRPYVTTERSIASYLVWRLGSQVAFLLVGAEPGTKPIRAAQESLASLFEGAPAA